MEGMKFRSQEEYSRLMEPCPPSDFLPMDLRPVFRWTYATIDDPRNFTPQFYKNPKRFLSKSDAEKCKSMGLSLFHHLKGAKERFHELKNQIGENVYSTLGSKIAEGFLTNECGVNGKEERLGHFTHHPSMYGAYEKQFNILEDENL